MGPVDEDCIISPPAGKAVRFRDRPTDPERDPLSFDMWLWHDGRRPELGPGETAVIPAGDPHRL